MLSLWQKSSINFMVQDKFVSDFQCSVRFKGFLNLSQTMNFVTDWANGIFVYGKNLVQISWSETNLKTLLI